MRVFVALLLVIICGQAGAQGLTVFGIPFDVQLALPECTWTARVPADPKRPNTYF